MRDNDWKEIFQEVKFFCSRNDIKISPLEGLYNHGLSGDETTVEHYYQFDTLMKQQTVMMDLYTRFNDI